MNVLLLAGVGLAGFLGLWLVQTVTLMALGHDHPIALPLRHGSDSGLVCWILKGALQLVLAWTKSLPVSILLCSAWGLGELAGYLVGEARPPVDEAVIRQSQAAR